MIAHPRAPDVVSQMTLAEKAALCSGADFWHTKAITRVGVPAVTVTDGPHGVRLKAESSEQLGLGEALPSTCFPTASALAATWDPELIGQVGSAIAEECLEFGVGVLLGPGANLKRSPLNGRNFEYFSEDPHLTAELATAFVAAVQSVGIGTSLKHFAANNQEFRRMTIDAVVDERTLRELELAGFEAVVRRAQPWTVMCAYNRLNGTYAGEHPWLLTEVLKREWGHDGIVVTDWGAMNDRVAALQAGCELEMPGVGDDSDARLVAAVQEGALDEAVLDAAAERLVALALTARDNRRDDVTFDRVAHHALARRVAADAAVLCRNEPVRPTDPGTDTPGADTDSYHRALPIRDGDTVALLGTFAIEPRYQGTGSSRITPTHLDDLKTELTAHLGDDRVTFAPGYGHPDIPDADLLTGAVRTATAADVAVICVGLPDGYENEGNDRTHLRLPRTHDGLIAAVAAVHPRVVVVLSNGAPVEMPWLADVEAVVEGYLGGQAGGGGLADVLTGVVNPSGHLAETFPRHLDDVPATRNFPGGPTTVEYREGLYVGYRFHDTVDGDVLFPFGHGLSYTSFEVGDIAIDRDRIAPDKLADGAVITVSASVTNTGELGGKQVVQVYVRDVEVAAHRPDRELRAFAKVPVAPGETARVALELGHRAFAFWDTQAGDWVVEPGEFEVLVGTSSRELHGSATLTVTGDPFPRRDEPSVYRDPPRYLDVDPASFEAVLGRARPANPGFTRPFTRNTPIRETADRPFGRALVWAVERQLRAGFGDDPANEALVTSMVEESPLRTLLMGGVDEEQLDTIIDVLNGRFVAGGRRAMRSLLAALDRR